MKLTSCYLGFVRLGAYLHIFIPLVQQYCNHFFKLANDLRERVTSFFKVLFCPEILNFVNCH